MKIKEVMSEAGIFKGLAKGIGQALAPNTMASNAEIPTQTGSRDFEYKGNTYRWLGQQWGVKGPGGYSPASEEVQQQLNALIAPTTPADQPVQTGANFDLNSTLDDTTQYRFDHPEHRAEGISIIVRKDGWYVDKLPKGLRGQMQRDPATRLYKVKQPKNIQKFNDYYNKAADAGRVIEEPADVL